MELSASYTLEYSYKRSTGPIVARFFQALAEGKLLGARVAAGKVICPPTECDPETGEAIGEFVEVGPLGTITTWTWAAEIGDAGFAWALIKLDGSDSAMLHKVSAPREKLRTGLRVRARFADSRSGGWSDLIGFEIVDEAGANHG